MRLFHVTRIENAEPILAGGFIDGTGTYMTGRLHTGVWLSNVPFDDHYVLDDDYALLEVDLDLSNDEIAEWDWGPAGQAEHEFLILAAVINSRAKVRKLASDDPSIPHRYQGVKKRPLPGWSVDSTAENDSGDV